MFDIGARLKELREKKGLSQSELADLSGVERGTISRIENNHLTPSLSTLITLCSSLEVTLSGFFCFDLENISEELEDLLLAVKKLSPEQLSLLAQFIKSMTDSK
ncbi:transcriptional regulator [Collibacillus ludicampi]|uniref:Transcriptional regulator n=1 Tax=Collibacillus ludicampi TaxID=2771369 RepID=A0AAV4LKP9_9BACL|nr:helix-turn-helix transcriptional regulator [Collibacillus ludicampi]GIM48461.1 transcriptional regulator [Collibacillus ludicampi]